MDNKELISAIKSLEIEKGIDPEMIFSTIESAIVLGIKKKQIINNKNIVYKNVANYNKYFYENLEANLNRETGKINLYIIKTIVLNVNDKNNEISSKEARKLYKKYKIGSTIKEPINIDSKIMGRMVAQTVKQIITQKIKEIERDNLYEDFIKKEKNIISCIVIRKSKIENNLFDDKQIKNFSKNLNNKDTNMYNIFLSFNNGEIILPPEEQIYNENYYIGQRLKVYVVNVKKTTKSPIIIISRRHKELIKKLFESEVPEIFDKTVIVKDIVREAGSRTKMSVMSNNKEVDPIGSCIGPKGVRINNVLQEISQQNKDFGEKIDIINYSEDQSIYIENALSPAKILKIKLHEKLKEAKVLVSKDIFSLAIGKDGQNVRLAARLTGWKIDIISDENKESLNIFSNLK